MTYSEARKAQWKQPGYRQFMLDRMNGPNNPRWCGGRRLDKTTGYMMVRCFGDPTRYRAEHIIIAERSLGRRLKKGEVVHHINCDRADNRNSNLLICKIGYHRWLHEQMATAYAKEHFGG